MTEKFVCDCNKIHLDQVDMTLSAMPTDIDIDRVVKM